MKKTQQVEEDEELQIPLPTQQVEEVRDGASTSIFWCAVFIGKWCVGSFQVENMKKYWGGRSKL